MLYHHSPQRKNNGGTHLFYGLPDWIHSTNSEKNKIGIFKQIHQITSFTHFPKINY
jgi:hypothetical protein